jgi:hypothetical protein
MSTGCAIAIFTEVNALEAGIQPWPIFFAGPNCDINQWPPQGQIMASNFIGTSFNMRTQVCRKADGNPDDAVSTSNCGNNCKETIPVSSCPLPAIQSVILPSSMSVVFQSTGSAFPQYIKDPGQFTLTLGQSSKNIFQIDHSADKNKNIWKSSTSSDGTCVGDNGSGAYNNEYAAFNSQDSAQKSFDNVTTQMTQSNLSCGMPFWPSLTSAMYDGYGYAQDSPSLWLQVGRDADWVDTGRLASYCYTNYNGFQGTISGNVSDFIQTNRASQDGPINCGQKNRAYSTTECLQGSFNGNPFPNPNQNGICACTSVKCDARTGVCGCDGGKPCLCQDLNRQANGTLQNITIKYTDSTDWETQQFKYCIGLDTLTIGGFPIERYGNGTPACDEIVPRFCFNTAWTTANPVTAKACACLLEQERINIQFTGLDLPVQCFSDICSNNDPNVYRTSQQQEGCSARICTQIISINGSAISSEGYQTILCDGQEYTVNTFNPSVTPVPTVSPNLNGGPVELGPVFYIALGLLVIMVVLLVAWGIRKAVLQKRSQAQQRSDITKALQTALNV